MYDIALIGGAGYVGNALINYFDQLGSKILVIDNFIYGHSEAFTNNLGRENVDFKHLDFTKDLTDVVTLLTQCNSVVLLGGLVGDPITKKYPLLSNKINIDGIQNLLRELDLKLSNKKIIFISTCSNYGLMSEGTLANEDTELKPLSLYAEAKVAAESYIIQQLVPKAKNIYTILRFATAFGLSGRMRFDLTVNQFARSITLGEELIVFDADTWRPYCHVNDFARLIELVITAEDELVSGQVFNAGGDENNHTKRSIVNEILQVVAEGRVCYQEHGSDPRNYKVDFSKVSSHLGFQPTYSVKNGINEIYNAIQNGFFDVNVGDNNFYGNYRIG